MNNIQKVSQGYEYYVFRRTSLEISHLQEGQMIYLISTINQSTNEKLLLHLYGHFYSQMIKFWSSILNWRQQSIKIQ